MNAQQTCPVIDCKACKEKPSDNEKLFFRLGWLILEAKYAYYVKDDPLYEDHVYDQMERKYDALAKVLGVAPTVADMIGFDEDRPSCQQVISNWYKIDKAKRKKLVTDLLLPTSVG